MKPLKSTRILPKCWDWEEVAEKKFQVAPLKSARLRWGGREAANRILAFLRYASAIKNPQVYIPENEDYEALGRDMETSWNVAAFALHSLSHTSWSWNPDSVHSWPSHEKTTPTLRRAYLCTATQRTCKTSRLLRKILCHPIYLVESCFFRKIHLFQVILSFDIIMADWIRNESDFSSEKTKEF